MARTEAYDRKAFDAWIYLFGGKSDLFPIVMRDFVDCATFIVHLPFLFQQINIGSEMDGRTFIERETCYWSLNATIEIPPAYMSNHRFRVLKNIIYEIRMKRSIFRSILSIASFSIIFLFGKENEKRLFYFVHYLLVPERISISSQNEILFQWIIGCASLNFYQCKEQVEWFHAAQMRVKIAFYIPSIKVQNIRAILSLWDIIPRESAIKKREKKKDHSLIQSISRYLYFFKFLIFLLY